MVTTVNYHSSGSLLYTVRHETLQDKASTEDTGSDMVTTVNYHSSGSLLYTVRHETLQDKASKSVLSPDQSRRPPRHDEGWQAANRKGRAAMTWKTYCGNLLWQSGLTLLVPVGSAEAEKSPYLQLFMSIPNLEESLPAA